MLIQRTRSDHGLENHSILHTLCETARRQVKKAIGLLVVYTNQHESTRLWKLDLIPRIRR